MKGDTYSEDNAPEPSEKVSKIKADDDFYRSKPKYIWVELPQSKLSKKKGSKKNKDD